jgi:heme a synthase
MQSPHAKLGYFTVFVWISTIFLLYAGGFTTTIRAGMVFLDWPLSNGSLNPDGWMQDEAMLAEHSHRLLGMWVGSVTLILALWTWRAPTPAWLKKLGWGLLVLVVLQGLLGGFRVLFDSTTFAIIHGCLAQLFLCALTAHMIGLQKFWQRLDLKPLQSLHSLKPWGLALVGLVILQLIVAAVMRHNDAGLAIPTFPLNPDGSLIPNTLHVFPVAVHFLHRVLAALILVAFAAWVWRLTRLQVPETLRQLGLLGMFLLILQIALGAAVIWTVRPPILTTLHMLNGALFLVVTWASVFLLFRPALAGQEVEAKTIAAAKQKTPSVSSEGLALS